MKRIYSLDYLRGLAAFSIMIYHFFSWSFGHFNADSLLGKFGIYGVSIFYILSGLTLYHVYHNSLELNVDGLKKFAKKRIIRIFPLLWLVTIVTVVLFNRNPDLFDLFLNLTGTFGFIRWDKYFSPGVWSIGNELVFYVFFPIFIYLSRYSKTAFILFSLLISGITIYFTFFLLDPSVKLETQWKNYINPLNQVFLFLSGFIIGYLFINKEIRNVISISLIAIGALIFYFYPSSGNVISIVTGFPRIILSACCILICLGFYKSVFNLPSLIHKPLVILGEISYSVYLLHPIVYNCFNYFRSHLDSHWIIVISIIASLIASYIVYNYYERFFTKRFR